MMDADDLLSGFSAKDDDEKQLDFEQSTLSLVLKQLGASAAQVRWHQQDLGPTYGFGWFNDSQLVNPYVTATRLFNFSFEQIYTRPSKSPLIELFESAVADAADAEEVIAVFQCFKLGRQLATNIPIDDDQTHIHVSVRNTRFNVVPLSGFFAERYGPILQEQRTYIPSA
jgi:hypothetical protein